MSFGEIVSLAALMGFLIGFAAGAYYGAVRSHRRLRANGTAVGRPMKLHVKPIFGYGWSDGSRIDVPPPFTLEAEALEEGNPFGSAVGQVSAPSHPLHGLWIVLSQRHRPNNGACNLWAFKTRPNIRTTAVMPEVQPALTGFAGVTEASDGGR